MGTIMQFLQTALDRCTDLCLGLGFEVRHFGPDFCRNFRQAGLKSRGGRCSMNMSIFADICWPRPLRWKRLQDVQRMCLPAYFSRIAQKLLHLGQLKDSVETPSFDAS